MSSVKANSIKYTGKNITVNHTTLNSPPEKKKTTCKCGSTSHSRTNHKDCPLKKPQSKPHKCNSKCKIDRFGRCSILQNNLTVSGF